ncbi:acyltransferase family protein [Pseudomonas vranovensis]|uniref:acyltransferase family protein n=1 Tax=Pseudomonas vranovensis TaxID=321661 RepID=UPI00048BBAC7|nr:acyltransferase [Pseudomonas vranovensis]
MTLDQSQQLDSIRALAAFSVLLGHTYQTLLLPTLNVWFTAIVLLSQFAVMAFFVLSGFLIGKSVCNNILKNSYFDVGRYFFDRSLRLYPPLMAALVLMVGLGWLAPFVFPSGSNYFLPLEGAMFIRSEFVVSVRDIWGALTFLNGFKVENPPANSPLWSLSIEAWYYVVAAAIVLWGRRKVLSTFLIAVVAFVSYGNALFYMLAPVWFAGFGLAFIHQRNSMMKGKVFWVTFLVMSFIAAASIAYALYPNPSGNEIVYSKVNLFRLASGLWFACFLALLLGGVLRFPKSLHRHASYSYTLYVVHFPIMLFALGVSQHYIYGHSARSWLVSCAVVFVSIGVSRVLSRWLENKAWLSAVLSVAANKKSA